MRWLDSLSDSMGINLSKLWKIVEDREVWHAVVHGAAKSRTQLSDSTTTQQISTVYTPVEHKLQQRYFLFSDNTHVTGNCTFA